LAAGDTTGAIASFHRAIDVGTPKKDPIVLETAKKLRALEAGRNKTKGD
jgi:hypothetical protein